MSSWLHSLDPVAFRIPVPGLPPLEVRWYGLAYLVGFYLAFLLLGCAIVCWRRLNRSL